MHAQMASCAVTGSICTVVETQSEAEAGRSVTDVLQIRRKGLTPGRRVSFGV